MLKSNLKIAFLISGMARNYIYCSPTFKKHILDNCNGDMFISFKRNSRTHYSNSDIINQISLRQRTPISDRIDDIVFLKNLFGNKLKYFNYDDEQYISSLKNEKLKTLHENLQNEEHVINMIDQYARVKNIAEKFEDYCNKTQTPTKYDIVVRLRLDKIWWTQNINITDFIKNAESPKLYLSYINWTKSANNNLPNWIQDYFFMGNKDDMIYIMKDFFTNMYNSYEFTLEHKLNKSPEIQLGNYINSNSNLQQQIVNSEIRYKLCPYYFNFPLYLEGYYIRNYNNKIQ